MRSTPPSAPAQQDNFCATSLIKSLLSLPELPMRILWLNERVFRMPFADVARSVDELAAQSQSTNQRAREAMISVAIFLAQKRDTSLIWALREEAAQKSLLGLERLVREQVDESPLDIEAEQRVPDYGRGRELTVGERRSLARRPTRTELDRLLHDPHPLVLEQLLKCPKLTEDDVIRLAARRPAHQTALVLIAASARWMARKRLRITLIQNPGTPHGLALPLVTLCPRDELYQITSSPNLSSVLRAVAYELYLRLPPVSESLSHPQYQ